MTHQNKNSVIQFNSRAISTELTLIKINHFDSVNFVANFANWLTSSQKQKLKTQSHNSKKILKLAVIFELDKNLKIDSADLALVLEVSRQQFLIPLGFVNTSKLVADYASFTNLALFDLNQFKAELNKSAKELPNESSAKTLKKNDDENSFAEPTFTQNHRVFYKNTPKFINADIKENMKLNRVTFIKGNVYLSVEIRAKNNVYIYGSCYGQVSVAAENGQIFIQKLRARRIKIGCYYLESSQYKADWIDKSVVFYVKNRAIQTRLIDD